MLSCAGALVSKDAACAALFLLFPVYAVNLPHLDPWAACSSLSQVGWFSQPGRGPRICFCLQEHTSVLPLFFHS